MPIEGKRTGSSRALWWLRVALVAVSAAAVLLFLYTAWLRLRYPYEYDWIEDGMLASLRHICSGLPLYAVPNTEFTPYLYTPLYLYLAALLAKFTGVSYVALRLLSILSTLGSLAVLYGFVLRETRLHFAAAAAAGLFAACYAAVGGSFDIGRVDMLYIFFVLCAIHATRYMHPLLAALLWVCAFQTKQGVLPVALLLLCWNWRQPRRVLIGLGGFVVMMGASVAWMNHISHGWYRYYVFGMAGGFGFDVHKALQFVPEDLMVVCGIALLLVVMALVRKRQTWRTTLFSTELSFYVLGTIGMVVFTGYIRAHLGANTNSLIPAYAWCALLFGVALGVLYRELEARGKTALLSMVLCAAVLQIAVLRYAPDDYSPDEQETMQRDALESTVRSIPGDVLVLSHPEYARLAGKQEYASSEAIGEVIEAKQQENGDRLMAAYAALIHGRRYSAIVLDKTPEEFWEKPRTWAPRDLPAYYPLRVAAIGGDARRFASQPRWIYLPCPVAGAVDVARTLDAGVDESACGR